MFDRLFEVLPSEELSKHGSAKTWNSWKIIVMAGLSASSLAPLNRILSATVRLVAGLGPRDHVTEHMKRLHRLPIQFRITFNMCSHA